MAELLTELSLNSVLDFSKLTREEKIILLDEIFERQRRVNESNPDGLINFIFFFKLNEVYSTKKEEILSKLTDQKTGKEIVDLISSFFFFVIFFR